MRPIPRILLVACLAFAVGACGSPEDKARDYLERAQKLMEKSDFAKADIELRNALKFDPRLAEAHFLRAKIFEANKSYPEMYRELQTTVQIDETHLEANLLLATIEAGGNRIDEAQAAVERARKSPRRDYRVTRAQALILAREERLEEALAEAKKALAAAPKDAESQMLVAGILLRAKQYDQAVTVLEKGLSDHPDLVPMHVLNFQLLSLQQNVDGAVAALEGLIALQPKELSYRQMLALYLARNQRVDEAEAVMRKAVGDMPDNQQAKLLLASFLAQTDTKAAAETLRGFIAEGGPGTSLLQLALGDMYAQRGELEEASELYRAVSASDAKDDALTARNQLVRIAVRQGKMDEARALIEDILKADPVNADALTGRAAIALSTRETDAAIADLRQALDQNPQNAKAHILMARAHVQNGSLELAKASLVEALKAEPANEEAAAQLAGMYMQERRFDKALEILEPLAKANVRSDRIAELTLQARLAAKDWAGANELAGKLGASRDDPEYQKYVAALASQGQGNHEEAIAGFREVLKANPRLIGALTGLSRSYRELGKVADGMKEIRTFIASHEDNLEARQLLVAELIRDRAFSQAREELEAGLKIDPTWMAGYRGLGGIAMGEQKPDAALAAYARALQVQPDSVEFQLLSANVEETVGRNSEAEARYRAILAKAPTADVAANNLAVLIAGDGKDKARLDEAHKLASRFENSGHPTFADTYAWILYQRGNYAAAAEILDRVVKRAPEQAVFRYHLGAALLQLNDTRGAKLHLSKAEKLAETAGKYPGYDEAMAMLARIR
jgi:cellulose synthase operon protein C